MNKQQFVALLKLGLIQSNPQMTNRLRSKGKNGDDLIKGLLLQNLIFPIFIVILYGGIFMVQNLYQYPGQFNGLFLVLVGISLSQGISLIYNTFFDNNDFASAAVSAQQLMKSEYLFLQALYLIPMRRISANMRDRRLSS